MNQTRARALHALVVEGALAQDYALGREHGAHAMESWERSARAA